LLRYYPYAYKREEDDVQQEKYLDRVCTENGQSTVNECNYLSEDGWPVFDDKYILEVFL